MYKIDREKWGGTNSLDYYVNKAGSNFEGYSSRWQDRMYKNRFINKPTALKVTKTLKEGGSINRVYWDDQQ